MEKRAQSYGEFFRYTLVVIVVVMILVFGFKAINEVRSSSCAASMALFKGNLKKSIEELHGDVGSINEKDLNVPCDVDKIYFVDLDKDMSRLNKSLQQFPLLRDAIESDVGKNVFLIKNEKVVDSFYAGNIGLKKPYYVCSETTYSDLGLYLGGEGDSTEVVNKNCTFDCTFEVVEVTDALAEEILNEAKDKCKGCPEGTLDDEMELFKETNKFVKIMRRCNCGRKPGEAVVEILIKPEGTIKHFKLIESIPKEYVDDLYNYLETMSGGYSDYKVIYDPLIVWHFDEISEETIVRYTLNTDVFEYCADVLQTIGYGFPVEGNLEFDEEDLDAVKKVIEEDDPLKFELPDEVIEIKKGHSKNNVFNKPVWHFVSDVDVFNRAAFKDYTYEISDDGVNYRGIGYPGVLYRGPNYPHKDDSIQCWIDSNSKQVICEVRKDFSETEATFDIRVTNPGNGESVAASFTVTIFDCGNLAEQASCGTRPLECEWCVRCGTDNKLNSYGADRCVNLGNCLYGDGTDSDGDGFNVECANDCSDNPSEPNSVRIPNSANPYCDCNTLTGGGATIGIEEKGSLCFDSYDNNCDGNVDNCYKLECSREVYRGCSSRSVGYRCQGYDRGIGGSCCDNCEWYDVGTKSYYYYCYDDWETECMESPVCVGGFQLGGPISCMPCPDGDGDGHQDESCGGDDCDDSDPCVHPGTKSTSCGDLCTDGKDNDCNGKIDCENDGCPCGAGENCRNGACCSIILTYANECTTTATNECGDIVYNARNTDGNLCGTNMVCQGGSCVDVGCPAGCSWNYVLGYCAKSDGMGGYIPC